MAHTLTNVAGKLSVLERLVSLAKSATGRPALLVALATLVLARNRHSRWVVKYAAIAVPLWPLLRAFWQRSGSAPAKHEGV
jgi:hypothetical protein